MRVMVLMKGDPASEAGGLPDEKFMADMLKFNDDLVKAGVLLASEGLYPSAQGVRVKFSGGQTTVIDGPFTETKELIAGFWLWQVKTLEEAIEWVKRLPAPAGMELGEAEIEIRPVFEQADLDRDIHAQAK